MGRVLPAILRRVPGLPSAIGRARFERLVGPLPPHVSAVFALFDLNLTVFRFEPPFERNGLLQPFEQTDMRGWPLHRILLAEHVGEPTRQFHRVLRPELTTVWLYLNDNERRGVVLAL